MSRISNVFNLLSKPSCAIFSKSRTNQLPAWWIDSKEIKLCPFHQIGFANWLPFSWILTFTYESTLVRRVWTTLNLIYEVKPHSVTDIQNALLNWITLCPTDILTCWHLSIATQHPLEFPKRFYSSLCWQPEYHLWEHLPYKKTTRSGRTQHTVVVRDCHERITNKAVAPQLPLDALQEIKEMLTESDDWDHNRENHNHSSTSITFLLKNCSMLCQEMKKDP